MTALAKPTESASPIAILDTFRLPWHDNISDRFQHDLGVSKSAWKVLTESIWPGAKTTDSIVMALSYCQHRKLDPFKKPVHIVPIWDSKKNDYIETVWPSIAEMRTTAFRTGQYAGCDETAFGPDKTQNFKGKLKRDNAWKDVEETVTFPEWAQVTIYRMLNGVPCKFVGPKVYWLESYARQEPSDIPNRMWSRRRSGQLEKVAEAAALRKAFPEELGNDYAAEEMEGQRLFSHTIDHEPTQQTIPKKLTAPPPPASKVVEQAPEPIQEQKAVAIKGKRAAPPPPTKKQGAPAPGEVEEVTVASIVDQIENARAESELVQIQKKYAPFIANYSSDERDEILEAIEKATAKFGDEFPGDRE